MYASLGNPLGKTTAQTPKRPENYPDPYQMQAMRTILHDKACSSSLKHQRTA